MDILYIKFSRMGKITKIFQNSVKKGALQNGITKEEIETELENFIKEFNKYNIN